MPAPTYLEIEIDRGWEVWISSDDQGWIVEFVRSTNPKCILLASQPRPFGATIFPNPPIALHAVRAALFDDAGGPNEHPERAPG